MQRQDLKQRIDYLVEYGGAYPESPPQRWRWVVPALLALIAIMQLLQLLF